MNLSKPRTLGALLGAGLVVALYFADAALKASGGTGLSPLTLLVFLLPGVLASWLSNRSDKAWDAEKEGALAGLTTAHFASLLLIAALITAAANIDWAAYEGQVGPEIANGVRAAVVPAAIIAGLVAMILVYAVCVLLGWLGALLYRQLAGSR
jgi:hypothetical protein